MHVLKTLNQYSYTHDKIRDAIHDLQYKMTEINIDFLKVKGKWSIKKDTLYYGDRQIVPKKKIDNVVRKYFSRVTPGL